MIKKRGVKTLSISLDPEYRPVCGKSDAINQRRRYLPPSGQSERANRPDTKSFSFVQAPFNQFGFGFVGRVLFQLPGIVGPRPFVARSYCSFDSLICRLKRQKERARNMFEE